MPATEIIAGIILAGGRSSRMAGQDKATVSLAGVTLLERAMKKLGPQVAALAVNSNDDPARLPANGLPVLADTITGYAGPLAGILTGLEWFTSQNARYLATVACDTPFFPGNLVQSLAAALPSQDCIALAASGGRIHPVFGLWPVVLANDLRHYVESDPRRSVLAFAERHEHVAVDFPFATGAVDPFFNINTPQDLAEAEILARKFSL